MFWDDDRVRNWNILRRVQSSFGFSEVTHLVGTAELRSGVHAGQHLLVENGTKRTDEWIVAVGGDAFGVHLWVTDVVDLTVICVGRRNKVSRLLSLKCFLGELRADKFQLETFNVTEYVGVVAIGSANAREAGVDVRADVRPFGWKLEGGLFAHFICQCL